MKREASLSRKNKGTEVCWSHHAGFCSIPSLFLWCNTNRTVISVRFNTYRALLLLCKYIVSYEFFYGWKTPERTISKLSECKVSDRPYFLHPRPRWRNLTEISSKETHYLNDWDRLTIDFSEHWLNKPKLTNNPHLWHDLLAPVIQWFHRGSIHSSSRWQVDFPSMTLIKPNFWSCQCHRPCSISWIGHSLHLLHVENRVLSMPYFSYLDYSSRIWTQTYQHTSATAFLSGSFAWAPIPNPPWNPSRNSTTYSALTFHRVLCSSIHWQSPFRKSGSKYAHITWYADLMTSLRVQGGD